MLIRRSELEAHLNQSAEEDEGFDLRGILTGRTATVDHSRGHAEVVGDVEV